MPTCKMRDGHDASDFELARPPPRPVVMGPRLRWDASGLRSRCGQSVEHARDVARDVRFGDTDDTIVALFQVAVPLGARRGGCLALRLRHDVDDEPLSGTTRNR